MFFVIVVAGLATYETEGAAAVIIPTGDIVMALPCFHAPAGGGSVSLLLPWGQEA